MRPAAAAALLAFAVAAPAAAGVAAGSWEVVVARPGLVRVAWPAEAPADVGLEVRGPAGEEVAWQLVSLAAEERHSARVTKVQAVAGGWELTVDAGASPPLHQGLRLPLAEAGAAALEVEASPDGVAWRPLATATLFRLGGGAALQHGGVEYPATDVRFLRLRWPEDAGFPRLADVELEVVAGRDHHLAVDVASCDEVGPRHTRCTLEPAGRPVRALELALAGGTAAGWRLRRANAGAWEMLGEGTWSAAPAVPARRLALPATDAPLLLDLWGEDAAPRPEALALLAEPLAVEMSAAAAGTYRLTPVADRPASAAVPAEARQAQWLTPSPAAAPPPSAAQATTVAGAALPDAPFARKWPVVAEAAVGEPVRLELSSEVLETARPGLDDLRLAAADHQVPFVLATAVAPARTGEWPALAPTAGRAGASTLRIPLSAAQARDATLVLRTASRHLRRSLRLRHLGVEGRGVATAPPAPGPWTPWECRQLSPLPCEIALALPAGRGDLEVEIADGDDAPLSSVEAELWQPRRELRFRWPAAPVALLAGSPGLAAPRYELAAVDDRALVRAKSVATLGPAVDGPAGALARWPSWVPLAALGAAAAMLLLVLARALRGAPGQPS